MTQPVCHHCHIVLTFPQQREATKAKINEEITLYFHPSCHILFLRFVRSVLVKIVRGLEIAEDLVDEFSDVFEAQKVVQKMIDIVLEKFKRYRFSVRAQKIYDFWILATRYLHYQPNIKLKIRVEIEKVLESSKLKKSTGPP